MKEKLNTIQENLTKVEMDTIEDMPFSKFLVRISNSYYQTIGKFTKSLLTGGGGARHDNGEHLQHHHPSKRQFMAKYKDKQKGVKLHSLKNEKTWKS